MPKRPEKMLYETWLDLSYAHQDNRLHMQELAEHLKDARSRARKSKRLVLKAAKQYEDLYGQPPKNHRNPEMNTPK